MHENTSAPSITPTSLPPIPNPGNVTWIPKNGNKTPDRFSDSA